MSRDFRARMDWAVNHVDSANHPPVIKLEHGNLNEPLIIETDAGETLPINASESFDPDGNMLQFAWWIYKEPGTYDGNKAPGDIINPLDTSLANVTVPQDARPGDLIHVILELKDLGEPSLKTYQRIVLKVGKY